LKHFILDLTSPIPAKNLTAPEALSIGCAEERSASITGTTIAGLPASDAPAAPAHPMSGLTAAAPAAPAHPMLRARDLVQSARVTTWCSGASFFQTAGLVCLT